MELAIKLDLRKSGETKKGFPIVVYASNNYKIKKWRTGHYSKVNEWNEKLSSPKSKHPDYYIILDYLNDIKASIGTLLSEQRNYVKSLDEIKEIIFNKRSDIFYDAAIASFPIGYKGTIWSAVRSFNSFERNIAFSEITNRTVMRYRDYLVSKGNKPSGIDSYIRSLRATWNKLSTQPNPFKGVTISIPDKINIVATSNDIKVLNISDLGGKKLIGGYANYRNYWLLMFYLGGIDPEALSKLRYDTNVVGNRIVFNRSKGRSNMLCNNLIPDVAWQILNQYDCKPYLVPIFRASDYNQFRRNFSRRMQKLSEIIGLSVKLKPKSARYTFIDRAQQLLVDERITAQIVGHKRKTVTSVYTNDFPQVVQDESHKKIILID
tara:strand:- start:3619 stop:4752 length:1134 start_codon:yes stop_codon:yes gene_type:complete